MARDRIEWERDVIYHMECIMEMTTSDAQGVFEINHFYVTQEWGKGSEPETAAQNIAAKLNAESDRKKAAAAEYEMLFIPIDGYVTNDQLKIKVSDMDHLGFDQEAHGWAYSAGIGDSKSIDQGTCKCVLIRMK